MMLMLKIAVVVSNNICLLEYDIINKPMWKKKVVIWSDLVDRPNYLWSDICSGNWQFAICSLKGLWSYMTPNVLTETRWH